MRKESPKQGSGKLEGGSGKLEGGSGTQLCQKIRNEETNLGTTCRLLIRGV